MDGKHLQTLIGQVRTGEMNRRGFLRATAALGLSAGAASVLFKNVAAQDATAETSGSGEIIRSMSREEAMAEIDATFAWEEPQNQGGEIIHTMTSDIKTLNPTLRTDVYSGWITRMVYDFLFGNSYIDGRPLPTGLADSWEIAEDGVTYTIKLHEGVKWHDGEDFTADDVIHTFDGALAEDSLSVRKATIEESLLSYEKIDDLTVQFVSKTPNAVFLQDALNQFEILPKHIWEGVAARDWPTDPGSTGTDPSRVVGTGPFKFVEWQLGDHVTIERNPDYWKETDIPVIDQYIYKVVGESTTAISELQTGQTDVIIVPPTQAKRLMQSNPELQIVDFDTYGFNYYTMNLDESKTDMFQDVRVRQALMYALDRDLIAETVYDGYALRADGTQPVLSIAYAPDKINTIYTFDPDKARSLLDEAGWSEGKDGIREKDGKRLSFECVYSEGSETYEIQIPYMQQAWREVGVEMLPSAIPFTTQLDVVDQGNFEMSLIGFQWGATGAQEIMFGCKATPPNGFNEMHYCSEDYDALIEPSKTTLDQATRAEILIQMTNIVNDDQPAGITVFRKDVYGGSPRIHNFFPNGVERMSWLTRAWVDAE